MRHPGSESGSQPVEIPGSGSETLIDIVEYCILLRKRSSSSDIQADLVARFDKLKLTNIGLTDNPATGAGPIFTKNVFLMHALVQI